MNERSYICRLISERPDWEKLLKDEYHVSVHRDGHYAIFKYSYECDFADPVVQEARGIIIDTDALEVKCWPFRKFGNFNESYADAIDWSTASVQEKVDGSIIKLWYDDERQAWQFSTNGSIRAETAPVGDNTDKSFGDIIKSACNYGSIPFNSLDREKTYIFELVSPETRVIIPYNETKLYHLGTRHRVTGIETDEDIGIVKPARYTLHSLEDCISAASKLNEGMSNADDIEAEGYVVVDANWNRVKVKSPGYLAAHYISEIKMTKENVITMLREQRLPADDIIEMNPRAESIVRFYQYQMAEADALADEIGRMAETLYEEYQHDRKLVADVLMKNPLWGSIGFKCIDTGLPGRECLETMPLGRYLKLIRDYEHNPVTDMFNGS